MTLRGVTDGVWTDDDGGRVALGEKIRDNKKWGDDDNNKHK